MKTLYLRIVVATFFIVLLSSVLSFLLSNLYYQETLKNHNGQRLMNIAEEVVAGFTGRTADDLDAYLKLLSKLSYQMYLVDEQGHGQMYGSPFKNFELDKGVLQKVIQGQPYQGVLESKHGLFVTGFFENTLENSVGVPLQVQDRRYALFLRPDIESMLGEVRILLAVLLGLTFVISLLLLVFFARYLVKPIKRLTSATQEIAEGEFDIQLDVSRGDELGDLARHFARMAQELKKVERMRQEFVANVSHEIQSPLTSIQGFSQALRTESMPEEEKDAYLAIIEQESRRLSALGQQLLTLAGLEKEEKQLQRTTYRLDEQLRETVLLFEWQWQEKQLELELDLPEVTVQADRNLWHLVWINLLANAIKFTEPRGKIAVSLQETDAGVVVTVRDTGVGIPSDELPRVFERFFKADKARNRTRPGSGLGLSIVEKVIRLHRGRVAVESEPGVGTVFSVKLPKL